MCIRDRRGRVARGRNGSHRHTQPRRNIFVRHLPTQHFVPHFVAAAASDGTDIEYGKTQEPWQKGLFPLPVMEKRHDGRPVVANEPGPPVIRFEQYDLMPFATKSFGDQPVGRQRDRLRAESGREPDERRQVLAFAERHRCV